MSIGNKLIIAALGLIMVGMLVSLFWGVHQHCVQSPAQREIVLGTTKDGCTIYEVVFRRENDDGCFIDKMKWVKCPDSSATKVVGDENCNSHGGCSKDQDVVTDKNLGGRIQGQVSP